MTKNLKNLNTKGFVDLTRDPVFKYYFKSSKELCADLIQQFIPPLKDKKVKILQYMDSDLPSQDPKDKHSVLDILVQTEDKELINIEMQCFHQKSFKERVLFYWAKLFTRQVKAGGNYHQLKPAYSLIFTDYTLFKELKKCCSIFRLRCDEEPGVVFSDHLQLVLVELNKFKSSLGCKNLDEKGLWMYLLKRSSSLTKEEAGRISSRSRVMKKAVDKLGYLSKEQRLQIVADFSDKAYLDEKARLAYARDEGLEKGLKKGRQEGMEKGMEKGVKQTQKATALNMLKEKADINFIAKVTGLSLKEIKSIKKTL